MRVGFAGKSGSRARAHRGGNSRLLRIIGGDLARPALRFPAAADIRPTPDRVRETLFNWLGGHIAGRPLPGPVRRQRRPRPRGALARRGTRDLRRAGRARPPARTARAPARVAGAGAEVRRADALACLAGPPGSPFTSCSSTRPLARSAGARGAAARRARLAESRGAHLRRMRGPRGAAAAAGGLDGAQGEAGRRGRVSSVRARHGAGRPEQA